MTSAVKTMGFSPAQLRTIKHTVAKDTNDTEFDLFLEACRSYGLDPFRKQIHATVYSKDNAQKRKMSIIVSRDGLRVMAQRCADYRPASEPAKVVYDENLKSSANPKGIVSASVTLWKQDNRGEWYPVIGEADWDEFAPLKERWDYNQEAGKRQPTGIFELDTSGQWGKMPKNMIVKCAESQALRAGWPDQFGGVYSEEEMDHVSSDHTASEEINRLEQEERQLRIGGPAVMMVFDDSMVLERVSIGKIFDRCSEFLDGATPEEAYLFSVRNSEALREFWANDKSAALEVKRLIEAKAKDFDPTAEARVSNGQAPQEAA